MHDSQRAHRFDNQVIELIGVGASSSKRERFEAVYRPAGGIFLDERGIAQLLSSLRDFVERIVPRNVLPISAAWASDLRLEEAAIIEDLLFQRGALGAEGAAIDWIV